MSAEAVLPDVNHISQLLTDTLAKEVVAKQTAGTDALSDGLMAVYANDGGEAVAVCICDLSLAVCLGAALTLVPAKTALQAVSQGNLSETMQETVREVLNIAAQLFRPQGARRRIALGELYVVGQPRPPSLATQLSKPAAQLDLDVTISSYTTGRMCLLTLDSGAGGPT